MAEEITLRSREHTGEAEVSRVDRCCSRQPHCIFSFLRVRTRIYFSNDRSAHAYFSPEEYLIRVVDFTHFVTETKERGEKEKEGNLFLEK